MGSEQSRQESENVPQTMKNPSCRRERCSLCRLNELNWIPNYNSGSLQDFNELIPPQKDGKSKKNYIDLRSDLPDPPPLSDACLQVCQIVSVAINHALLQSRRLNPFLPSPHFWKYLLTHWQGSKQLHSIQQLESVITHFGACPSNNYKSSEIAPSELVFNIAAPYRHVKFRRIEAKTDLIVRELQKKRVVVWGMSVHSNFLLTSETSQSTLMPLTDEDVLIGGLCGLIVGYIEKSHCFIMMLARGNKWGDQGYILLPESYIERSGEAYVIRLRSELVQLELDAPTLVSSQGLADQKLKTDSSESHLRIPDSNDDGETISALALAV